MIILLVVLVIVLLLFTIGYVFFFLSIVRLPFNPLFGKKTQKNPYEDEIQNGADWFQSCNPERIVIPSDDGLHLCGYFLPAENAAGTLLLVHGYRSSLWHDFGMIYQYYHSLGWNILAISQRSHGESEGKYITLGIKERFDVKNWALYLFDRFGPEHNVVLNGISMGSTTVLMALGTGLPSNVRGAIADCGYTNPYDQLTYVLKSRHLPARFLLALTELHSKAFADFRFRDYSTITALKQNHIPVLFLHGEADTLVPVRFTIDNYAACAGAKQLFTVPNAGHGGCYPTAKEQCQSIVEAFLSHF